MHEQGVMLSGLVSIYTYMTPPKSLSDTWVVESPFQTLAVGLLVEIYRLALPLRAPETLSSGKSRIPYLMHTLLYLSKGWHNYGHAIPSVSIVIQ